MDDNPLDTGKLLVGLVNIIAGGNALAAQFERLVRDVGVAEGEPTIIFLTGIKKILRELPDKAFIDKNARLAMVDGVQEALDHAIEKEEEMQENQEGGG